MEYPGKGLDSVAQCFGRCSQWHAYGYPGYHEDIASWWFPQSCHFWQPCALFCLLGLEEKGTGNWETKRPSGFPEWYCSQSQLLLLFSVARLGHSGFVSHCGSSGTIPFKVALWVSELHSVLEDGENCQGSGGCLLHTPPRAVMSWAQGGRAKTSCQTRCVGGAGTCPASVTSCHPKRPSEQFWVEMSIISVGRMEELAPWIKCLQ